MSRKHLPMIALAFCAAGLLAAAFGYVAHDGLGYPREQIRDAAIVSASLLGTLLLIDYLSKLRRAK